MSFPPGTEMFQFPGFASRPYGFRPGSPKREGFPHSDTRGSTIARISPRLFAACHVLHRLSTPRHPPDALFTLRIATTTARTQDRAAPRRGARVVPHERPWKPHHQRALTPSLSKLHNQFRIHL